MAVPFAVRRERKRWTPKDIRFGVLMQPPLTVSERCAHITPIFSYERYNLYGVGGMKGNEKSMAILNLADSIRGIPGDIVEAGVAGGTASLALLFYLGCVGDMHNRTFHLFDTWQGLPKSSEKFDKGFTPGSFGVKLEKVMRNAEVYKKLYTEKVEQFDEYGMMRRTLTWDELWSSHVRKYIGTFEETMPAALADKTIAMLMCDGDMYLSTTQCLQYAEPRVSPGGWIYEDDYYAFIGSNQAVQDYRREARIDPDKSPILLVLEDAPPVQLQVENRRDCQPPTENKAENYGTCFGRKVCAAVWRKY